MIDFEALFEAKKQELGRVEQREAFLRSQLEEAVQIRLKLIGQLELLQQMYQEQQLAPDTINAADTIRIGGPVGTITADNVWRADERELQETANGSHNT